MKKGYLNTILKLRERNKKMNENLIKEINELKKVNLELMDEIAPSNKSWWNKFTENSDINGLEKITFLGTTFTALTNISLTTIKIEGEDTPKPLIKAIFENGKTDYISIERIDNHCLVTTEIWNKNNEEKPLFQESNI